jgi:chromosome partitioning protein
MEAIIGVANVARRVGRTTTAVHLAAGLALRGFETLLVDCDPQAVATALLLGDGWAGPSLADVLRAPDANAPGVRSSAPVTLSDVLAATELGPLRLAPSAIALAAVEGDESPLRADGLHVQLAALGARFDFAVIDTPPSLGPLSAACLAASTHLLAPAAPEMRSVWGLQLLLEALGNMPCTAGTYAELLGVVCNLFDPGARASGEFYEGLRRLWGRKVFETIIHRDAPAGGYSGCPVQLYAPSSTAAALYGQLTDEVLARLGAAGVHAA